MWVAVRGRVCFLYGVYFDLVDFSGFGLLVVRVFMVVRVQGLVVWIALSFGCLLLLCTWYGVLG